MLSLSQADTFPEQNEQNLYIGSAKLDCIPTRMNVSTVRVVIVDNSGLR
jgi:hypothetical protein